jgi:hypothetical protein
MGSYINRFEMIKSLNPKVGVEVGVRDGDFAAELLTIPSLERLVLIDAWQYWPSGPYTRDSSNCDQGGQDMRERNVRARFADDSRVEIIKGISWEEAGWFEGYADFVFLDARHDYAAVLADLIAWGRVTYNLMSHDYFNSHEAFRVMDAVDTFIKTQPWQIAGRTSDLYPSVHLVPS